MTAYVYRSILAHTVELTSVLIVTLMQTVFMDVVAVEEVILELDMSVRKKVKSQSVAFALFIITACREYASVCLDLFVKKKNPIAMFALLIITVCREDASVFLAPFVKKLQQNEKVYRQR